MSWLARRVVLRALVREWQRVALSLFAVALGVAVFLAIRLANRAAVTSFEGFTRGVSQGSDFTLRAESGPLKEADLPRLLPALEEVWLLPMLEGSWNRGGTLEGFQLVGVDLVAAPLLAEPESEPKARSSSRATEEFYALLQEPDAVLVSRALADAEGLRPGQRLEGFTDGRPVGLCVGAVLPDPPGRPALQRNLLVMDLPAAQRLMGREGELDRVEAGLLPGVDPAAGEATLRRLLPDGWTLEPPEQRASSGRTMTAAFRFNLTILSLIGLAVGAYLLFQAFDAAVTRRQESWATLRALGLGPGALQRLVLLEAALVGGSGSLLGLGLGWLLAQGAVRGVSQTMNALYGASAARSAAFAPGEASVAFLLGLGLSLAAGWLPARRAAATPPVQLLARGAGARPAPWRPLAALGAVLLAAGVALAFLPALPPGRAWHAYSGAVLVLAGGSLAAMGLLPLLGLPGRSATGWRWRLGLRPLLRPTGRHGFAAAALAVAVGMAVGMGVMVQSFEGTVRTWIGASLRADVYLSPQGAQGAASRHRLPPELAAALAADPAVDAVDAFHLRPLRLQSQDSYLGAGDLAVHAQRGHMTLLAGGAGPDVLMRIHRDGLEAPGAVASETFSRRFGLGLGSRVALPTPSGPRTVTVRGIYADYGNERGSLILDLPVYRAWFDDARPASLAIYLRPGTDADAWGRALAASHPGLQVRANAALRQQVTTIFRQTFAITYALEFIGLAVAAGGLAQALVGLALSRRSEIWTLRALGVDARGLTGLLLLEGLGVGLAGTLGGLGIGLVLSRILVDVLNPQVFGWTLTFSLPWSFLGVLLVVCLGAVVLAVLPMARWSARLGADRAAEEGA